MRAHGCVRLLSLFIIQKQNYELYMRILFLIFKIFISIKAPLSQIRWDLGTVSNRNFTVDR